MNNSLADSFYSQSMQKVCKLALAVLFTCSVVAQDQSTNANTPSTKAAADVSAPAAAASAASASANTQRNIRFQFDGIPPGTVSS